MSISKLATPINLLNSGNLTDSQQKADIEQAQLCYLRYRDQKDPARGMFTRFYGAEWTEEYIHGFLFDLETNLALAISSS